MPLLSICQVIHRFSHINLDYWVSLMKLLFISSNQDLFIASHSLLCSWNAREE
jgi:hypothetical protein